MSKHGPLSEMADAFDVEFRRLLLHREASKFATGYIPTMSPSREVEHLTARLKLAESANATLSCRLARADAERKSMAAEIADLKASINAMSLASMVNAVSASEVRPLIEELREHTLSRGTLAKGNAVLERLK